MCALVSPLLITILAMAFSFGEAAAAVDKDVVLAMPFEEGKGEVTQDLSPHGNNGALKGAKWDKGKFGQALMFDGASQVEVENNKSLSLHKTDFTLAIWLNFEKDPPKGARGGQGFTLMGHDEGGGSTNKWIWWYSGNGVDFHINTTMSRVL